MTKLIVVFVVLRTQLQAAEAASESYTSLNKTGSLELFVVLRTHLQAAEAASESYTSLNKPGSQELFTLGVICATSVG